MSARLCSVLGCGRLCHNQDARLCSDHGLVAEGHVTPELVETAARALAHPTPWDEIPPGARDVLLSDARDAITAVAPLIDRAARADELHQQARRLRDLARGAEINATNAVYSHPDGLLGDRWDAIANDRFGTAKHLETCAAALIHHASEEN